MGSKGKGGGVNKFKNRNEKKMKNNFITQQVQKFGDDFSIVENVGVRRLRDSFPRIAREIIQGNYNYYEVYKYFCDPDFLVLFIRFLEERYNEWSWQYNFAFYYIKEHEMANVAVDPYCFTVMEISRIRRDMASVLLSGMKNFQMSPSPEYLICLTNSLNNYVIAKQDKLFY